MFYRNVYPIIINFYHKMNAGKLRFKFRFGWCMETEYLVKGS